MACDVRRIVPRNEYLQTNRVCSREGEGKVQIGFLLYMYSVYYYLSHCGWPGGRGRVLADLSVEINRLVCEKFPVVREFTKLGDQEHRTKMQ